MYKNSKNSLLYFSVVGNKLMELMSVRILCNNVISSSSDMFGLYFGFLVCLFLNTTSRCFNILNISDDTYGFIHHLK